MTEESNSKHQPAAARPAHNRETAPEQRRLSPRYAITGAVIIILVFAVLATVGILNRRNHDRVLADATTTAAAPAVIALPAKSAAPAEGFVLPGNVTAFTDSPIYARTSGYLTHWYFDIGARVKGLFWQISPLRKSISNWHRPKLTLAPRKPTPTTPRPRRSATRDSWSPTPYRVRIQRPIPTRRQLPPQPFAPHKPMCSD